MEKVGDSCPQPAVASSGEGGPRLQAHSCTVYPAPCLRPLRDELWVPLQVSRSVLLSFAQNCMQTAPARCARGVLVAKPEQDGQDGEPPLVSANLGTIPQTTKLPKEGCSEWVAWKAAAWTLWVSPCCLRRYLESGLLEASTPSTKEPPGPRGPGGPAHLPPLNRFWRSFLANSVQQKRDDL